MCFTTAADTGGLRCSPGWNAAKENTSQGKFTFYAEITENATRKKYGDIILCQLEDGSHHTWNRTINTLKDFSWFPYWRTCMSHHLVGAHAASPMEHVNMKAWARVSLQLET